jgi:hypothetical protein
MRSPNHCGFQEATFSCTTTNLSTGPALTGRRPSNKQAQGTARNERRPGKTSIMESALKERHTGAPLTDSFRLALRKSERGCVATFGAPAPLRGAANLYQNPVVVARSSLDHRLISNGPPGQILLNLLLSGIHTNLRNPLSALNLMAVGRRLSVAVPWAGLFLGLRPADAVSYLPKANL